MAKNLFLEFGVFLMAISHPKFLLPMLIHYEYASFLKISQDVCN
ncbi:hypothetical protein T4B_13527 [Trichinella pseudospiralis]|uniref:Uncharacterized protein n=1 Tax=Trichinella pseudospiralis TaxID=6337 RepID=A0A0V1G8A9_TRIPS|nr:hypothetical protein T4B_13527 [Trichinella pseudospiralis]